MKVFVFGNEDLPEDSLPLRILPELIKLLPEDEFIVQDPNEEWPVQDKITVIDTVVGIQDITVFEDMDKFAVTPNLTMHDFDALTNLRYLKKLGKIKHIRIIGVPPGMDERKAVKKTVSLLK